MAARNALGSIGPIRRAGAHRCALSGLDIFPGLSQGVALGFHMTPLWGF